MYGTKFAIFAVRNTYRDTRAEYARLSHTTGFFYAVKSSINKILRLPNLTASFLRKVRLACLLYCFNDKGGSRFLFCLQLKQYKMKKTKLTRVQREWLSLLDDPNFQEKIYYARLWLRDESPEAVKSVLSSCVLKFQARATEFRGLLTEGGKA